MAKVNSTALRWIPTGAIERKFPEHNAVVFVVGETANLHAIAYSGRRKNHDWNFRFSTEERLNNYIDRWLGGIARNIAYQEEKRTARKAFKPSMKVGDILYATWGYEQTNVDFYQVIELHGKTMVVLREIAQQTEPDDQYMTGKAIPVAGAFVDEPFVRRVLPGNNVAVKSFISASIWGGRPVSYSTYG